MRPGPQKAAGTARRTLALGGRVATTTAAPPPGSTRTGRARSAPAAPSAVRVWGAAGSGSCAQPSVYLRQRREGAAFPPRPEGRGFHAAKRVRATPRIYRHPYRGTTRHVQSAFPFMADAGLGSDGVIIGRDALRRTFCYDPFVLYQKGRLNGPNMLVLGDIGYGKSALTKSYLYRQAVFGYSPLVTDVKGEYDRLCEALEVNPIRFVSGGRLRLNPLDPKVGGGARLTLLRSIAELLLGRQLFPREGAALEQAYEQVDLAARRRRRQPRIPEVVTTLLRPSEDGASALETTVGELQEWGRDVAFSLRRLITGDLAGMFDEETSPGLDLDARMASVNLRAVRSEERRVGKECRSRWSTDH